MKLSLVATQGKLEGKVIPIRLSQFLIGRDPQCHLRPASPMISKRHCALLTRGDKVLLRDFESTNGTFVNEQPIKGEIEIHDGDQLRIGPLEFKVQIEVSPPPVNKPTPAPAPAAAAEALEDEDVAAMLLAVHDETNPSPGTATLDSEGIPTGSTVMDLPAQPPPEEASQQAQGLQGLSKKPQAKPAMGNTSTAAKAILDKYTRRPRT